jgi:hypothetical protein
MAGVYFGIWRDAWLADVGGASRSNGSGGRLQVGCAVAMTFFVDDNYIPDIPASSFTSVVIRLMVRATFSCYTKGSAPKFWVERTVDKNAIVVQNGTSAECTVSTGGTTYDDTLAGGALETTHTNRVKYEGTPSVDAVISINITAQWKDWWAARTRFVDTNFTVVLTAADAATGDDETNTARKIAFNGVEGPATPIYLGGTTPDLRADWTAGTAPAAPSVSLYPQLRQTGSGTRTFTGDFNVVDAADIASGPSSVLIEVSRNADMSSPIHSSNSASGISYNSATRRWQVTRTYTEPRDGALYYWRCKVTGQTGLQSAYSAIKSYPLNRLPTATKVRPT